MYSQEFFNHLSSVLKEIIPKFSHQEFIRYIFDKEWSALELKQRTRKVTLALHQALPDKFEDALPYVLQIAKSYIAQAYNKPAYPLIFLPDYIEVFGLDHFEKSMKALELITPLISAEFAIRPFIIKYPIMAMKQMTQWSKNKNHHVRRLASEGCRPRLPWAMGLPAFKKDPSPIIPILENLKDDTSEYVRRSVANNLNDIAKDHPDIVIKFAKKWKDHSPETNWILKHGSRTLLKQGHPIALSFHGFYSKVNAAVLNLKMDKKKIKIGTSAEFSFIVVNKESKQVLLRIEYAIYYLTSTGKKTKKVFQIKEKQFQAGQKISFKRKQRFTDFTTRKHFPGKHKLEIIVNGTPKANLNFQLGR